LCSASRNPVARRCAGCCGAPAYDDGPAIRTFFCGRACQRSDWNRHRTECKVMQARKSLARAAAFLEALLVRIRKAAYPFAITSIEREASTIMLVSSNDDQLHESKLTPLPTDLASLQDHPELVKPICLHASGAEAMIYFCNVIKDMLSG
ncbi:uncharacterized protein BDZ83DRAFT_539783, partial [Colletotrichum acutatum]